MASRPEAERGGRPRAPLIGHAGPLVKLFRVNGQRLTEAAAAGRAQPVGGGGRGCRGNRATSSWLPLAGRLCCAAPSGSSGSLSGGRVLILFPCRAAGTGRRHPQLSTPEHPLPTRGAQVKKKGGGDCPARREEGEAPPVLGGSPLGESRTARSKKEHSHGPAVLREEVGFCWMLPNG